MGAFDPGAARFRTSECRYTRVLLRHQVKAGLFFVGTMLLITIGALVAPKTNQSEAKLFVRIGANETNDYYEYEQPLTPSPVNPAFISTDGKRLTGIKRAAATTA